jgi:hypothetical protein
MNKQPYELSVWEDITVQADTDSGIPQHFDERKLAIIGADDLDSQLKAYNVTLKETITGDLTLTFSMLYKYFDESLNEKIDNPFFSLLTNERKLKLREGTGYDFIDSNGNPDLSILEEKDEEDKWHDFIIKSIDKDSTNYTATITAKEIFVNELGKNGWSVLLDTELENNYGTVIELGKAILEDSDWTVDEDNSYSPTEKIEEPLFYTTVKTAGDATKVLGNSIVTLPVGAIVYPFYSNVEAQDDGTWKLKEGTVQVLYKNGEKFTPEDLDDNLVVIDDEFNYNYEIDSSLLNAPSTTIGTDIAVAMNGNKIQKTPESFLEKTLDKYVQKYKIKENMATEAGGDSNKDVYKYIDTTYATSAITTNYLTNTSGFVSNTAWSEDTVVRLFPDIKLITSDYFSYLSLAFQSNNKKYTNDGPRNERISLTKDNIYVVRVKARWIHKNNNSGISSIYPPNPPTPLGISKINVWLETIPDSSGSTSRVTTYGNIASSNLSSSSDIGTKGYATPIESKEARTKYNKNNEGTVYNDIDGYVYTYIRAIQSTDASKNRVRLAIQNDGTDSTYNFCIEDIQLFDYYLDSDDIPIFIGDTPGASVINTPKFYQVNGSDVIYLSSNEEYYEPVYMENYQSVRSINVKESNYFNALQSLAETFEVWVRFKIDHKKNGKLWLENGAPSKKVIFSRYSPYDRENYLGFKYGINLKSIKRTVDSDSIATKVIVKQNNQEYATDGTCSIARAQSNPSGESEILNFNYYIHQGFLSYTTVLNDLYGTSSTDFRYYPKLKAINDEYAVNSELLINYEIAKMKHQAEYDTYDEAIVAADEEIASANAEYIQLPDGDDRKTNLGTDIQQLKAQRDIYEKLRTIAKNNLDNATTQINNIEEQQDTLEEQKIVLKKQFYTKYSRFIQEGTWTDESYIDDELYYLDAQKIASVSAYPKISYSISVIDLEGSEDYPMYKFRIGERTYIEDPEFFGYVTKIIQSEDSELSVKTPYKMDAIISDRTRNFDDLNKSTITIKNYKNQYEELFQQIQATTQALQYESGAYDRAAGVITTNGEINVETLEKSFLNNSFILSNSQNQNVIWDTGTGIEVTDNNNTNNKVRIVAGGIFLTTDGGQTWVQGITGNGINTKYLVAGQIDASKINIVQGEIPYFRWDKSGISAFEVQQVGDNISYNTNHYVKFNQYGIYGYNGSVTQETLKFGTDYTIDRIIKEFHITRKQLIDANVDNPNKPSMDEDDIYNNFDQTYELNIPGVSIETYINLPDKTIQQKAEYINANSTFALTYAGLQINDFSSQGDSVSITATNGFEIFGPYTFGTDISTYLRNLNPSGNEYTAGEKIPLVSLGRFYDIYSPSEGGEPLYGLRLRNNQGKVTLSTDNEGQVWSRDKIFVGQNEFYSVALVQNYPVGTYIYEILVDNEVLFSDFNRWNILYRNEHKELPKWPTNLEIDEKPFTSDMYISEQAKIFGLNLKQLYERNYSSVIGNYIIASRYSNKDAEGNVITINNIINSAQISLEDFNKYNGTTYSTGNEEFEDNTLFVTKENLIIGEPVNFIITSSQLDADSCLSVVYTENTFTFNQSGFNGENLKDDDILYKENIQNEDEVEGESENEDNNENDDTNVEINNTLVAQTLRELGIAINTEEEDWQQKNSVRIWAGTNKDNIANAPFFVLENGIMYAQNALIDGLIRARGGQFDGLLTIGQDSTHGIDGAPRQYMTFPAGTLISDVLTNTGINLSQLNNYNNTNYNQNDKLGVVTFNSGTTIQSILDDYEISIENLNTWNNTTYNSTDILTSNTELIINNSIDVYIEPENKIILWGGKTELDNNEVEYQFSVDSLGKLYAQDVTINGEIIVDTGIINTIYIPDERAGITSEATNGILFWIGASADENGNYDNLQSTFYLTDAGDMYCTNTYLRGGIYIESNKYGINETANDLAFWANADTISYSISETESVTLSSNTLIDDFLSDNNLTLENFNNLNNSEYISGDILSPVDYATSKFYVDKQGNVYANNLTLGNTLQATNTNITGIIRVGTSNNVITINGNIGDIYSGSSLEPQGSWWRISQDGSASFKNVSVRGELETVIFKRDKISSVGGTLLISPSVIIEGENGLDINNGKCIIGKINSDNTWTGNDSFTSNVWRFINKVTIDIPDETLTSGNNEYNIVIDDANNVYIDFQNTSFTNLPKGTTIISIDTTVNSIKLVAEEGTNGSGNYSGPKIEMRGPAPDSDSETEIINNTVFIGNLKDVLLNTIFDNVTNPGYGLFSDNVYLTGRLYLPNAGITNEKIPYDGSSIIDSTPNQEIRIWAGADAANRANAPFVVTQDGTLYATKGIFSGRVEATDSTFSGWLNTVGILIDSNSDDDDNIKDVFYVAYDENRDADGFPTVDDKILQIDKNGLSIWEGGLNIYSDSASGWRNEGKTGESEPPYGYSTDNTNPYPYISAIDEYYSFDNQTGEAQFRLYSSSLNIIRFSNDSISNGIKINDGKINFYTYSKNETIFNDVERNSWNNPTSNWIIGQQNGDFIIANNSDNFNNPDLYYRYNGENLYSYLAGTLNVNGEVDIATLLKIGNDSRIRPYLGSQDYDNGFDIII